MLDCLILGDSIAVGTHMAKPTCAAYAKGGINTWQFNRMYPGEFLSDVVIISLGSNDHKGVKTKQELEALRSRIVAKSKVVWILPSGNLPASGVKISQINEHIMEIAKKNGDSVIGLSKEHVSPDGIHPTPSGYKWIAASTKGK